MARGPAEGPAKRALRAVDAARFSLLHNGLTVLVPFLTGFQALTIVPAVFGGSRPAFGLSPSPLFMLTHGMANRDGEGEGRRSPSPGEDAALQQRLRQLGERLDERRPAETADGPKDPAASSGGGFSQGTRLASEFVAGILVGAAIGWFFDSLLGTTPWGLIVFVLLGFTAGAINAMRAAGIAREPSRRDGREES